jgi:hypothetical protein
MRTEETREKIKSGKSKNTKCACVEKLHDKLLLEKVNWKIDVQSNTYQMEKTHLGETEHIVADGWAKNIIATLYSHTSSSSTELGEEKH